MTPKMCVQAPPASSGTANEAAGACLHLIRDNVVQVLWPPAATAAAFAAVGCTRDGEVCLAAATEAVTAAELADLLQVTASIPPLSPPSRLAAGDCLAMLCSYRGHLRTGCKFTTPTRQGTEGGFVAATAPPGGGGTWLV